MKRYAMPLVILWLVIFIASCESESPTNIAETITFEVTASDNDEPPYEPICDPSLGKASVYPVSIEFKPEIRIYPPDSASYQLVELPKDNAADPEYFGVTPCKNIDRNTLPPCIPCCEDSSIDPCTPCLDFQQQPLNGNYRFTVTATGGKVVGIFQKKNYLGEIADPRDDAELRVDVCINGTPSTFGGFTDEEGGGIYVVVPID